MKNNFFLPPIKNSVILFLLIAISSINTASATTFPFDDEDNKGVLSLKDAAKNMTRIEILKESDVLLMTELAAALGCRKLVESYTKRYQDICQEWNSNNRSTVEQSEELSRKQKDMIFESRMTKETRFEFKIKKIEKKVEYYIEKISRITQVAISSGKIDYHSFLSQYCIQYINSDKQFNSVIKDKPESIFIVFSIESKNQQQKAIVLMTTAICMEKFLQNAFSDLKYNVLVKESDKTGIYFINDINKVVMEGLTLPEGFGNPTLVDQVYCLCECITINLLEKNGGETEIIPVPLPK